MKNKSIPVSFSRLLIPFVTAAIFIAVMVSGVGNSMAANSLEPVTLQLKWFHQFQFAGYYAALEKGFYEQEGLDVTIIERDLRISPEEAVLNGEADFGVSNSAILLRYLKGDNVVLLAPIFQHSPLVFISKNEPLLHTPKEFIGKKVLMSLASQDIELRTTLQKLGIDINDISIIDRFATPEDYFDPQFDVVAAYTTNQPYYLKQEGVPYSIIYPSTYGVDFYGDTLFTSEKQIKLHPTRVKKFVRASLKGWKYALNNQEELIDLIINKFGSLKTKAHLRFEAEAIRNLVLPELVKIGHTNPTRWENIADSFISLNPDLQRRNLKNFYFDPSVGDLVLKKETAIYVTSLFVAIIIILVFTILIARKLNNEIIAKKLFEEELKNREKYYRSLFENTGTATVILDKDSFIIKCNSNFAELSGLDINEIENKKKWIDFVDPVEINRMLEFYKNRNLKKGSSPRSYDFKFMRSNGEIRHVQVFVEMIGDTTDRIASLIDLTEKVKTQELLVQTEKMLSVGGLAAGMAHEINNPLAGILQGTQNIKRRIAPEVKINVEIAHTHGCECNHIYDYLEERGVVRMLDGIQASGERAALIVKNMLNFTRKNEEGKTGCIINELLDGIIDIISCDYDLRKKYDFKHTEIVKDYGDNLEMVSCYRTEIEQVMLNLVKNAAYAMYETSHLRKPRLVLRTRQGENYVSIEVEDNGPGITNEVKRRIFEPFFTTKSPGFGTGLGLSVSFFIITQNHSGIFEVESEVGKGSKFIIKLPNL